LFAVAIASRDEALIAGDQGRVLMTKDAGATWDVQPTITSTSLFAIAYRGEAATWVAGRGGAILRRTGSVATVKIRTPKIPPILRREPKLKPGKLPVDDGDIPKAVPQDKKKSAGP
jgi:photosystem II stability/assembly factor-like uncharacterized protein